MQILAYACLAITVISGIVTGVLFTHNHSYAIWVLFFTWILVGLSIACFWQQAIWDKETIDNETQKEPITINLSNEDRQKIVDGVVEKLKQTPPPKDEAVSVVFGIFKKDIIIPNEQFSCPLNVVWQEAKVINNSPDAIEMILPALYGDTKFSKGISFSNNIVKFPKIIGFNACPYGFDNVRICFKVVDIKNGIVMISINIFEIPLP